jgi:hypothetical protein
VLLALGFGLLGLPAWLVRAAAGLGLLALLVGALVMHRRAGHPVAEVLPVALFASLTSAYLLLRLWVAP